MQPFQGIKKILDFFQTLQQNIISNIFFLSFLGKTIFKFDDIEIGVTKIWTKKLAVGCFRFLLSLLNFLVRNPSN